MSMGKQSVDNRYVWICAKSVNPSMAFAARVALILCLCGLMTMAKTWAGSSINVPLGDWSYDAIDKLVGFGLIQSEVKGTRPYSRLEMARLVKEAFRLKEERTTPQSPVATQFLDRLQHEYESELAQLGWGSSTTPVSTFVKPIEELKLRYVYSDGEPRRFTGFPGIGTSIRATDGTPMIYNNDGVVYGQNHNFTLQTSSSMVLADILSGYIEPILMARQNVNDLPNVGDVRGDVLKGYGKLSPWNVEIEAGRDSLWWGQGYHGTLVMTNNAWPLDMVKITNPNPTLLPWIFQYLGPFKYTVFVAWLEEDRDHPHANLGGMRLNSKPLPTLELGMTSNFLFGGEGVPGLTLSDLWTLITFREGSGTFKRKADGLPAFDFRWQVPFLRNTEIYGEYGGEDTGGFSRWDEIIFKDIGYILGIYVPRVTDDGRLDFRFEYAHNAHRVDETPGFWYGHTIYRSGYTHDGLIMGHHMGPDAQDAFTRTSYRLQAWTFGLDYDYMENGITLSPVQEKTHQWGSDITYDFTNNVSLKVRCGYEIVKNFNMTADDDRDDHLLMTELSWRF
jgi:hypothetical protein